MGDSYKAKLADVFSFLFPLSSFFRTYFENSL